MFSGTSKRRLYCFRRKRKLHSARGSALLFGMLLAASAPTSFFSTSCKRAAN